MKHRQLMKHLEKEYGFFYVSQTGTHIKLKTNMFEGTLTVKYNNKEYSRITIKQIEKDIKKLKEGAWKS